MTVYIYTYLLHGLFTVLWVLDFVHLILAETLKLPRKCPSGQDHVDSNTTLLVQRRQIDVHACYKNACWTSQKGSITKMKWWILFYLHSHPHMVTTWQKLSTIIPSNCSWTPNNSIENPLLQCPSHSISKWYITWNIEIVIHIAMVPILWILASTNMAHLKLIPLASPRKAKCFSTVAIVSQPKYLEDEIQPAFGAMERYPSQPLWSPKNTPSILLLNTIHHQSPIFWSKKNEQGKISNKANKHGNMK